MEQTAHGRKNPIRDYWRRAVHRAASDARRERRVRLLLPLTKDMIPALKNRESKRYVHLETYQAIVEQIFGADGAIQQGNVRQ
jgi:hypothetical protein